MSDFVVGTPVTDGDRFGTVVETNSATPWTVVVEWRDGPARTYRMRSLSEALHIDTTGGTR